MRQQSVHGNREFIQGVNNVEFPFIGGHEIAAHIVELGDRSKSYRMGSWR